MKRTILESIKILKNLESKEKHVSFYTFFQVFLKIITFTLDGFWNNRFNYDFDLVKLNKSTQIKFFLFLHVLEFICLFISIDTRQNI